MTLKFFFGIQPLTIDRLVADIDRMENHLGASGRQLVSEFYKANEISVGEKLTYKQALALSGQLSGGMTDCVCHDCSSYDYI